VLERLESGELGDPLPVLAYLAGQEVGLPGQELNQARRRALLVLAAGGDPHRELGVDDPAAKALAADLFTDERLARLGAAIDGLISLTRDLPRTRRAGLFLAADVELAWRLFALALVAEELGENDLRDDASSEG
jgi:hypothetical protein